MPQKKNDPSKLSPETKDRLAREILAFKAANEPRPWETLPELDGEEGGGARPKQLPPDHPRHHHRDKRGFACSDYNPYCTGPALDWTTWIFMAGRGCGKTRAGAEWTLAMGMSEPGIYVGVCAPTFADVKNTCFENLKSGIIKMARPGEIADYNRNDLRVTLRNGSIIQGFSAEKADSVRGANLSYCWFDELAMIRYIRFFEYGLKPALRIKPKNNEPRLMITTTPKKMRLIRELLKQADLVPDKVHVTRARSEENPYFSSGALAELRRQYKGTYLERQELEGELIEEADGALFKNEDFCEYRVEPGEEPAFRRIVVAIDPATSASDANDETGIVVAAEGTNHHFYTLQDYSMRGTAEQQMQAVAQAFRQWDADVVVGEQNGVKDYLRAALAAVDPNIPLKLVPAMKGKQIRAQPVSVLASQGRIHMVGDDFEKLEEQLCAMTPDDDRSQMHDDRADAWVWAMRELTGQGAYSFAEAYGFVPCKNCGEDLNERYDKTCKKCGHEVEAENKEKARDRSTRWSAAYAKICDYGHEYPMRLAQCPKCKNDPGEYMRQALALSGASSSTWQSYSGGNWLKGRKI